MEAMLCTSTAIATCCPVRSPLLGRHTAAAFAVETSTPICPPLAALSAAAVSRSTRPGLGFSGVRSHLLRARATSDDSSTTTFGRFGTASNTETSAAKETAVAEDDAEKAPVPVEEASTAEPLDIINFLNQFDLKLDSEDWYSILTYGGGAFVTLWISSAIVGAIDSIPLFPKAMEIIGLGFTIWFTYRYLIFKRNRDELFEKIGHLKEQIFGPSVD